MPTINPAGTLFAQDLTFDVMIRFTDELSVTCSVDPELDVEHVDEQTSEEPQTSDNMASENNSVSDPHQSQSDTESQVTDSPVMPPQRPSESPAEASISSTDAPVEISASNSLNVVNDTTLFLTEESLSESFADQLSSAWVHW